MPGEEDLEEGEGRVVNPQNDSRIETFLQTDAGKQLLNNVVFIARANGVFDSVVSWLPWNWGLFSSEAEEPPLVPTNKPRNPKRKRKRRR